MRYTCGPSAIESSRPVTVTVCGMNQSVGVNVRLVGNGVPSPGSLDVTAIVTGAVGAEIKTTVNESLAPASLVISPEVGVTMKPGASSSTLTTVTSAGSTP